jgi:hypothetical protein
MRKGLEVVDLQALVWSCYSASASRSAQLLQTSTEAVTPDRDLDLGPAGVGDYGDHVAADPVHVGDQAVAPVLAGHTSHLAGSPVQR